MGATGLLGIRVLWSIVRSDTASGPAVARGRVFFGTKLQYEAQGGIVAVSADTGGLLWRGEVDAGASSAPVVAGGVVYIGSWSSRVHAFAARGCGQQVCRPLWSAPTGAPGAPADGIRGAVAVADGTLFVPGASGEVLAYRIP